MMELSAIVRKRKEFEELEKEEKKEEDNATLSENASRCVKTSFIGAIAAFENRFGYLWGHGKLRITEEQQQLKDEWMQARKEILDKGNDQIKLVRNEVDKYEVTKIYK